MLAALRSILADPHTRGMDLDDPATTARRRQIVREKIFLRRIYEEWYRNLAGEIPAGEKPVLELGSGAGFCKEFIPKLITSEIFPIEGIDVVLDGQRMPFADASLRGVVMTDVLHHLPRVRDFFREAGRCVEPGGVIAIIEPWASTWGKFVYRHFHHEPFEPAATQWEFPSTGPLSGANGALPWIIFVRDRAQFEREFPQWRIEKIEPMMPLRYLVSGGISMRPLAPAWSYKSFESLDHLLANSGMFVNVVLRREA